MLLWICKCRYLLLRLFIGKELSFGCHSRSFFLAWFTLVRFVFCVVLYSSGSDLKEEIIHDVDTTLPKLDEWKAHILRAAHQDSAKRDIIDHLSTRQVLLIMDWAMKFLPASFRETQRDWFGKKGKSWHVTVAVTRSDCNDIEVITSK